VNGKQIRELKVENTKPETVAPKIITRKDNGDRSYHPCLAMS